KALLCVQEKIFASVVASDIFVLCLSVCWDYVVWPQIYKFISFWTGFKTSYFVLKNRILALAH
ncbi:MAG: hypothetical protein R3353_02585, partial [Salegentibacter mishustinae]|nr:hypothetical protein [Salegentibacter mishustinae]